ncbi:MAG: hypothetical protein ACF8QF_11240 [Phycisphaerales bacterium]
MESIVTEHGGWADAELLSFRSDGSVAEVRLQLWNARTLALHFSDVILLDYRLIDVISDVVEATQLTDAMRSALVRTFDGSPPESHPFREWALIDIHGVHGLTVIAAEMRIERVDDQE